MSIVIMIAQLLVALSILVGFHEWGHMATAKYFGMRVEKFSIGFPPKLFGVKWGETEYSFGAIPLGGFVKISGMIDESLDKEQLKKDPEPHEFRAKPAWQRLIVMLGGVTVNVILGVIVFIGINFFYGQRYIPIEAVHEHGMIVHPLGQEIGFQPDDEVLALNGEPIDDFLALKSRDVILGDNVYVTVRREGKEIDLPIPNDFMQRIKDAGNEFLSARQPFRVGEVAEPPNHTSFDEFVYGLFGRELPNPPTGAYEAGLMEGDSILTVAGDTVRYFDQLQETLAGHKGETVSVKLMRGQEVLTKQVSISERGKMGVGIVSTIERHRDFTFGEALSEGSYEAMMVIPGQISAISKMISEPEVKASEQVSSVVGIASIYGGSFNPARFWLITGTLSMILAFANLLPIPALDGGHVMFLLYEMVSGREPSEKFMENAQKVGMVILLLLMALALGNDVFQAVKGLFSS